MQKVEIADLSKLDDSPPLCYGHTTCVVGDRLYLFGGCSLDGKDFFNELHVFDINLMEWIEKHSDEKIAGRHFHTCSPTSNDPTEGNKKLVIFGGKANGYRNDVVTFDILTNKFDTVEPKYKDEKKLTSCQNNSMRPPNPRYGHSSCYFRRRIFIFGGYDSNGFCKNDLYSFNLETNHWKKFVIAKIPKRYHHAGVLLGTDYYIIGGMTNRNYESLDDIYRLDFSQLTVATSPPPPMLPPYDVDDEKTKEKDDSHSIEAFEVTVGNTVSCYGHKCILNHSDRKIYLLGGRSKTKECQHLMRLDGVGKGRYEYIRWVKVYQEYDEEDMDSQRLLSSYNSIDMIEDKLLFFGGQIRGGGGKKKEEDKKNEQQQQQNEEEEGEEEEEMFGDDLPYDCIFLIFLFLTPTNLLIDSRDLVMIASTSKKWTFSVAARSDRIWRKLYEKAVEKNTVGPFLLNKVKRRKGNTFQKYMCLRNEERKYRHELMKYRPRVISDYYYYHNNNNNTNVASRRKEYENLRKKHQKNEIKVGKIVMIGDGAVGKTCLGMRYSTGEFPSEYVPTVLDSSYLTQLYKEKEVTFQLWDTAGEEDYDELRPLSYTNADLFFICFSVVNPVSLSNVTAKWYPEKHRHRPKSKTFLIGTKTDLRKDKNVIEELKDTNQEPVKVKDAQNIAKQINAPYFECSSFSGEGIQELFTAVMMLLEGDFEEGKKDDKCGIM